jgi:hypothetical protein
MQQWLAPMVAVFLCLTILLMNKEGMASLRPPEFVAMIVIVAAAFWFLFRPRTSAVKDEQRKHWQIWPGIAPLVALLAGPAIATLFWALDVYVLEKRFYVTSYERIEVLNPALAIGVIGGVIGLLIVLVRRNGSDNGKNR